MVKVGILAALLLRAQDEGRELTAEQTRLATRMIGVSDNAATDALYAAIGYQAGLTALHARLGMTASAPGKTWGVTRTTANDQARLLGALLADGDVFSDYSRTVATNLMTAIDAEQSWGVTAAVHPGERAAFKNGWLSRDTEHGWWIVNSAGRITGGQTDLTLIVLSHGNPDYRAGIGHVETISAMTRDRLRV